MSLAVTVVSSQLSVSSSTQCSHYNHFTVCLQAHVNSLIHGCWFDNICQTRNLAQFNVILYRINAAITDRNKRSLTLTTDLHGSSSLTACQGMNAAQGWMLEEQRVTGPCQDEPTTATCPESRVNDDSMKCGNLRCVQTLTEAYSV